MAIPSQPFVLVDPDAREIRSELCHEHRNKVIFKVGNPIIHTTVLRFKYTFTTFALCFDRSILCQKLNQLYRLPLQLFWKQEFSCLSI